MLTTLNHRPQQDAQLTEAAFDGIKRCTEITELVQRLVATTLDRASAAQSFPSSVR
jgi:hypothetical protein